MPDPISRAFAFVVPSLKVTGGNLEIVKLAQELAERGHAVRIVAMWRVEHAIDTGTLPSECLSSSPLDKWATLRGMPLILAAFRRRMRSWHAEQPNIVFSHYSTFPLTILTRQARRWFFVQDTEWNFAPAGRYRDMIKRYILFNLRRGQVLTTNSYLLEAMHREHISVAARIPIWIDPKLVGRPDRKRDLDLVLVLRQGPHKRADLGIEAVNRVRDRYPALRIAVITPDEVFATLVQEKVALCLLRPTLEQMRDVYERTYVFLLLSEHEGFGLPPLEAMASGCVPVCRDAGGVESYMNGELKDLILPLDWTVDSVLDTATSLLADPIRLSRLSALSSDIVRQGLISLDRRLEQPEAQEFVAIDPSEAGAPSLFVPTAASRRTSGDWQART